jgi:hypothetical protein
MNVSWVIEMKKLSLLSSVLLFAMPASAEAWHGLILTARREGLSTVLAPFETEEQCESAALKLKGAKELLKHVEVLTITCFKGK